MPPSAMSATQGSDSVTLRVQRAIPAWLLPGIVFPAIAAILLGATVLGEDNPYHPPSQADKTFPSTSILDGWFQFDAGWYREIAHIGYRYTPGEQSSVAFFPSYPLTMRLVNFAFQNTRVSGYLVTILAGLGAALLFARWARTRLDNRTATIAIFGLLLYPYSLFLYGSMYGDALFLLTAIGAFMLLERGHPVLAGLVGALAAAGRPVGVAVAIGLVVRLLELRARELPPETWLDGDQRAGLWVRFGRLLRALRWPDAGVLLSGAGLAAYMAYLWIRFDDPFAFATVQEAWGQPSGPATWLKFKFFDALASGHVGGMMHLIIPAILCLVGLALLPVVRRHFGWGYFAYSLFTVGIPVLATKDFMGTGRYLVAAFPVIAVAALLVARGPRWLAPTLLSVCGIGLVSFTYIYATGYPLS